MWTVLAYLLSFSSIALAGGAVYPLVTRTVQRRMQRRLEATTVQLEDMFVALPRQRLQLLYLWSPLAVGGVAWLLTGKAAAALIGAAIGLLLPGRIVKMSKAKRAKQFHHQLVDGLLMMSSCLKAGLSMVQAFGVMAEEMPAPISQEFGLVLKELRMGVNIDEALRHLMKRMPSDELHMFISTVLVARETGGDVTAVFTNLVETLRNRKKIKERITTLTFMAKMQGFVMAGLPFVFLMVTMQVDRAHFGFFLKDPMGQTMLMIVVGLQVVSGLLFMRFSRSPI